jgi:divalent metal cation (Fe/Co/Zn/Cd) transporter
VFALTGVTLAHVTGEPRWDALGSVAIGLLLVAIAILLAVEMKGLPIGESASSADVAAIAAALEQAPSVRCIIHLRTEHLGPDDLLVAAKLEFEPTLTVEELGAVIDTAEQQLRAVVPTAHFVFIEPDTYRAATT